jgi:hypothetical protein
MSTREVAANVPVPLRGDVFDCAAVRLATLVLLLTVAAVYESFHLTALMNGNIWWHLRAGLWILQKHAFPRQGLFSQYPNRPWLDCDWGFDLLTAATYKLLGLRALPALLMIFKVALAALTFLLARGRSGGFWYAILLSAIAQYVIANLLLLPSVLSILFFAIELLLLLQSRRHNDVRSLYWLPVLFFLWANMDEQFLIGLLLMGLFLAAEAAESLLHLSGASQSSGSARSLAKVATIAGVSLVATLLIPYSFSPSQLQFYRSAFQTAYSKVLFENFTDMQAMPFRSPQNFVLMLLVMAAFLALGRRRSRDLFKLGVMGVFAMLAFRVERDVWCVALPAIAVIADAVMDGQHEPESQKRWGWEEPAVAMLVLVVFMVAIIRIPSNNALMNQASRVLPVKACDFIRTNQLPGPLFNAYSFGGFVIWYLPEYPVAMDGRVSLYGDEITEQYFEVTRGSKHLETEPTFVNAHTFLLEANSGLLKAMTTLPVLRAQFRLAYQDDLAAVLVRQ